MTIKLNSIIPAPWNTRGAITPESVKDLAASIKEQGLINPITIWRGEDGAWYCIAGNRRLAAMKMLNLEGGEFCVEFNGSEHDAKMVTVTENLQREDVSPIEEAALVAKCLDAGMTAEDIAAKTGRSASWVNRRRKLVGLADEWKTRNMTTEALEHIASYPTDVQKRVAKKLAASTSLTTWRDVHYQFEAESKDLDGAKFDVGACVACQKRTGVCDLFGEADGKLGRCTDCKCFAAKEEARIEALIADATKDAKEVVRCSGHWEMPRDADSSPKRTKAHPCAYVLYQSWNDEIEVRWGESKREREERRAAEEEARNAEREEHDAEMRGIKATESKLDGYYDENASEWPDALVAKCVELTGRTYDPDESDVTSQAFRDSWIVEKLISGFCTYRYGEEWADLMRAFDWLHTLAGVTDEERDAYLAHYPVKYDDKPLGPDDEVNDEVLGIDGDDDDNDVDNDDN